MTQPPEELDAEARLLREAWADARRRGAEISQREVAKRYGVHFTAISQMLNGRIPIGDKWKLRFAEYLRVRPQDIWPSWQHANLTNYRVADDVADVIDTIATLDREDLEAVKLILSRMKKSDS